MYTIMQVFLHPADEIPMVRDLGFAVPPGRHSLIAVKASVVSIHRKTIYAPPGIGPRWCVGPKGVANNFCFYNDSVINA